MKKGYNLLSIYLDKKPIPCQKPNVIIIDTYGDNFFDIEKEYNIIDYYEGYRRKVNSSLLLSKKTETELYSLFKDNKCNKLLIYIDFYMNVGKTIYMLFVKRLLQVIYLLNSKYSGYEINILIDEEYKRDFCMMLDEIYLN